MAPISLASGTRAVAGAYDPAWFVLAPVAAPTVHFFWML